MSISLGFPRCMVTLMLPVLLFSSCTSLTHSVIVSGRMLDTTGIIIAGARVVFDFGTVETVTESDGTFQVKLLAGEHHLAISVQGNQIYNQQFVIPAGKEFDLGDLRPDEAFS